jgi:transglutaminase-like putative cysteine protease
MKSRLSWHRGPPPPGAEASPAAPRPAHGRAVAVAALLAAMLVALLAASPAHAADAPAWMRDQLSAPVPAHDDKVPAATMYSATELTVLGNGRVRRLTRVVHRILRPEGESYGLLTVPFDPQSKIISLHAWSIPPGGKPYEAKERDAVDTSFSDDPDVSLITDTLTRVLRIPGVQVGSLVGYELEQEERPYVVIETWGYQEDVPVREAHFTLRLPAGWDYRASPVNGPELAPVANGKGEWSWVATGVEPIKVESDMPPWRGIARGMVVSWFPAGGQDKGVATWADLGSWQYGLTRDRRAATPDMQREVATLTAGLPTPLAKMRALAAFTQSEIRYVSISLGIGGYQPHAAGEVFSKRYGDCKDKATLLATMLHEVGIEAWNVVINTTRGSVNAGTPPYLAFNHMITAVRLPEGVDDRSLQAVLRHPKFGRILFFDPTDEQTPFGSLRGELQANYGLLVAADGSELVALPQLSAASSGVHRLAHMVLEPDGTLRGTVDESRVGDKAMDQRERLAIATRDVDRTRPVEALAGAAFATYTLGKAEAVNVQDRSRPLEWHFSVEAKNYAKSTGGLLLVRPRVIGSLASGLLETDEPRRNAIEFDGPERDTDEFEIALPPGYEVDELPQGATADYGFATYQSRYSVSNHVLHYSRSFEIRQLSVPVGKAAELKAFYRLITNDERRTAVLSKAAH